VGGTCSPILLQYNPESIATVSVSSQQLMLGGFFWLVCKCISTYTIWHATNTTQETESLTTMQPHTITSSNKWESIW
jgi:hypothetical protein